MPTEATIVFDGENFVYRGPELALVAQVPAELAQAFGEMDHAQQRDILGQIGLAFGAVDLITRGIITNPARVPPALVPILEQIARTGRALIETHDTPHRLIIARSDGSVRDIVPVRRAPAPA